tara:strand:- start:3604 stop:4500 length:897 start_codon:yes stop_codon:yes gene_type:complete
MILTIKKLIVGAIKLFANILYQILNLFEYILYKLTKKKYLGYLYDRIRKNSYTKLKINNKMINFFTPNEVIQFRIATYFSKEPETLEWIDNFIEKENLIFWDIGANIGLYSIYAATKHSKLKVFAFEPSTNNLPILTRNIHINNLSENITVNQFPLTNQENVFMTMRENDFNEGGGLHTFGEKINFEGKEFFGQNNYKIYGTSIDYLLEKKILEIPDYIKIDVDGIEHLILQGAEKYLADKKIKSISVELNEKFDKQINGVFKILENNNFKFVHKKHASYIDHWERFSSGYNYIFNKI